MIAVTDAYRKSILFELVNRNNPGVAVEAFTLIIPPESIEIDEPQRISKTKTFGGIFIDDFGPEAISIVLSGTTGGVDLRNTYIKNGETGMFNGKTSMYYLRDTLMRYKYNRSDYPQYDLNVYDLSSSDNAIVAPTYTTGGGQAASAAPVVQRSIIDGYVCVLVDFKLSRSSNRPLWYIYRIELLGLRPMGTVSTQPPKYTPIDPLTACDTITKLLNAADAILAPIVSIKSQVDSAINDVATLRQLTAAFLSRTLSLATYPLTAATAVLGELKSIKSAVLSAPAAIQAEANMSGNSLYNMGLMMESMVRLGNDLVAFGKSSQNSGSQIIYVSESVSGAAGAAQATSGMPLSGNSPSAVTSAVTQSQSVPITVYGYTIETINDGTTLERLSYKYFGSGAYIELIALLNGLKGDVDLIVGNLIKIPVLTPGSNTIIPNIFSAPLADVFGTDIQINMDTGALMIGSNGVSGSFSTISGPQNVIQAINLRLSETLGSRLRLALYGIRAVIGGHLSKTAPVSYLLANIKDTIAQDPRIQRIDNLNVKVQGDKLYIGCDLTLVRYNDTVPYQGAI